MTISSNKIRLTLLGVPPIETLDDFSTFTRLSKGLIYRLSRFNDKNYFSYSITKKSGGSRLISQPSAELKALQSWILKNILDRLKVSPACKGFERQVNIVDNAKPHIGSLAVMCLDLDDFFPTIKVNQVWSVFRMLGYNPRIASVLATLCTYQGTLPQGSPASPKLSNLVCLRLDSRILGYVGKRGIMYTRYADDLSFSSYSYTKLIKVYPFVSRIIRSEDFKLNLSKTRFAGPSRRHQITGLIVNDTRVGIGRIRLRELRAKINHFCKNSSITQSGQSLEHIKGWLSFVKNVDSKRYEMLIKYVQKKQTKFPKSKVSLLLT